MIKTLYVGNLPWNIGTEELSQFFSSYGEVLGSRIIVNRESGRSRGFGFIEVNEEDVQKIVEATQGVEFNGRILTVNLAKARDKE